MFIGAAIRSDPNEEAARRNFKKFDNINFWTTISLCFFIMYIHPKIKNYFSILDSFYFYIFYIFFSTKPQLSFFIFFHYLSSLFILLYYKFILIPFKQHFIISSYEKKISIFFSFILYFFSLSPLIYFFSIFHHYNI